MTRPVRAVPPARALAWYVEAMRLWKRGPVAFVLLALVTLALDLGLNVVPIAGVLLAQIAVPIAGCGLLYASLAADRGGKPRLRDAIAVFGAPFRAIATVVLAGLIVFAAEAATAYLVGGIDMLSPGERSESILPGDVLAIHAAGIFASLPFTFVPFAALFDDLGTREAFAASIEGFRRNVAPLAVYAALSLALLLLGFATYGLGLLLAVPWWAASSYAAWKDIYGVAGGPAITPT